MEEEINLREYVQVLIRWRWGIAGLAFAAAVVAFGVSFLLPSQYEATALVAVTHPQYIMRFDPRFETTNQTQPAYRAYPELATSDELLQEVLGELDPLPIGVETLAGLRGLLKASSGADPSIVRLTVRVEDPQQAAQIANLWAELFVARANQVYGVQSEEQVQFFEAQLVQAGETLQAAEEALVAFQARNQRAILEAQLSSLQREQGDYLSDLRQVERLSQDIAEVQAQILARPGQTDVTLGDELSVLRLRTQALGLAGAGSPLLADVQLQVQEGEALSGRTVSELVALLDALKGGLTRKGERAESMLASLEPQILALQQRIQELENESERLSQARDVARETYVTLARKVDEAHIAAQDTSGEVRLASRAAVPINAVGPRKVFNAAIAGVLGLILGVVGAFAVDWWRGSSPTSIAE